MSVTIHDHLCLVARCQLRGGGAADLVAVAHVNAQPGNIQYDLLGECGIAGRIDVAENGLDRRDRVQLVENLGSADITSVKNELHSVECIVNAGANETVRIGNESQDVRVGRSHYHFYILGVLCCGYDWRFDWRYGQYTVRGSRSTC